MRKRKLPNELSASVDANDRHIFVRTFSGYGLLRIDPNGSDFRLPKEVPDIELGAAILQALSLSRMVLRKDDPELWDSEMMNKEYQRWIESVLSECGYKNKRALFKDMMSCSVTQEAQVIEIMPSNHRRLEAWSGDGISRSDWVRIPADSSPEEIGKAARLALSRCI